MKHTQALKPIFLMMLDKNQQYPKYSLKRMPLGLTSRSLGPIFKCKNSNCSVLETFDLPFLIPESFGSY